MTPAEREIIISAAVDARIARMRAAVICGMDSPWFEPYYELENPAASVASERPSADVAERP